MYNREQLMTELEKDVLQEIMNISFGQAAADLSEIVDIYVTLTVPHIDLLNYNKILPFIREKINDVNNISMIKQSFSGKFNGDSILFFPHGESNKLLQLFCDQGNFAELLYDIKIMEKETLIEISNIIMGVCIGKIAQLLNDVVSYSPPRYFTQNIIYKALEELFKKKDSFAIFLKTEFHFLEHNVSGFMFLICNHDTMDWLKLAVADYLNHHI